MSGIHNDNTTTFIRYDKYVVIPNKSFNATMCLLGKARSFVLT